MSRWDEYATTLGVVVSVDSDAGRALVDIAGAQIPAWMPDHTWSGTPEGLTVGPGVTVRLERVVGGYVVHSVYSGASAGGAPTLGPEMLANSGFELGEGGTASGWTPRWAGYPDTPAPHAISGAFPVEGARHLRVRVDPAYDHAGTFARTSASRIDPGVTYRLAGSVRDEVTTGSTSIALEIITGITADADVDSGSGARQIAVAVVSPGGAWQVIGGDVTVPAGHTYARVLVSTTATPGTDALIDVDALSLRQRIA